MSSPAVQSTVPDDQAPVLVGRERERELLSKHLAAALAGRGGLVLLGGEAGIGKTALAEALAREATEREALVLVGHCYDLSETPPYGPWVEAFARLPAEHDRSTLPVPLGSGDAVASQAALFGQVRDALAATASRQPLVLLLDDLHWADPASLDLLRSLARQLAAIPLLLLVTYRSDELTRRHPLYALLPALVREARADRLDLRRLDAEATRALVRARYALPGAEEGRLAAYLHDRAAGNPFYLGELLRTLEEEGLVRGASTGHGHGWALGDLARARVPTLLRQVIDGRVARLGEESRGLLAIAAVIGQEVPLDLFALVAEAREEALLDAIEGALEARLVEAPDEGTTIRFAHALIREALYEGLLPMRRRAWHRRAGEALAALPSPEPDAVAYHFLRAGDARAAAWLVRAGERAQRSYAWLTAAERYEAALALLGDSPATRVERAGLLCRLAWLLHDADPRGGITRLDEAIRLAGAAGNRALLAYASCHRGALYCLAEDHRRGMAEMRAGLAALEALPEPARARLAAFLAAIGIVFDPAGHFIVWLAVLGHYAEARATGERALARLPDAPGLDGPSHPSFAYGYWGLGWTYGWTGQPERARWAFGRARDAFQAAGEDFRAGSTAATELSFGVLPYRAEQLAERRRLAAEAERLWARAGEALDGLPPRLARLPLLALEGAWTEARAVALAGHAGRIPLMRAMAAQVLGPLARAQGDAALAWALVRETLPDGPATVPGDLGLYHAVVLQRVAVLLALDAGDAATARAWLGAHDRWQAWSERVLGRAEGELGWAEYHLAVGDAALAHQHASRALAHASEPRQPLALLAAHRLLGELDTAAGRHAEAAEHIEEALALAEACAAPYERALPLLAGAELRAATGNGPEARALLDEARAICTPLGAKPALARAEALDARLAAPTPTASSPAYPAGLTAREVEVLRLVAQGLSDAQIAERLYLSLHTVKTHLRSIYAKLDVPSRTAAARVAAERGLT